MGILSEKMESVGQEAYLYAHDVAALEARIEALEKAVTAYPEWDSDGFCLACNRWDYEGHNEDCPRAALRKEER